MDCGPGCLLFLGKAFFIGFLAFLLFGCKSIQSSLNDQSVITKSDSVKTITVRDSVFVEIEKIIVKRDTLYREKEDNTNITFGPGGGSYNQNTGEFTNVSGVRISKREKELSSKIEIIQDKLKQSQVIITSLQDSISKLNQQNNIKSTHKELYRTTWYWWLIIGAGLMLILIMILKSIPQTRWIVFWIK